MTVRTDLNRRARRFLALFYGGFLAMLALGGIAAAIAQRLQLDRFHPMSPVLVVGPMVAGSCMMAAAGIHAGLTFRCPSCRRSLSAFLTQREALDRAKCCPFCGASFDAILNTKAIKHRPEGKKDFWDDELA